MYLIMERVYLYCKSCDPCKYSIGPCNVYEHLEEIINNNYIIIINNHDYCDYCSGISKDILNNYKSRFPYCSFSEYGKELLILNKRYALDYGVYRLYDDHVDKCEIKLHNLKWYYRMCLWLNSSAHRYWRETFLEDLKPGAIIFTENISTPSFSRFRDILANKSFTLGEIGFVLDKYYFIVEGIKPLITKRAVSNAPAL